MDIKRSTDQPEQLSGFLPLRGFMPYVKFAFLSMLFMILYAPGMISMVYSWIRSEEYSHGFLIPVISGYLIWTKRAAIRAQQIETDGRGFFLFLSGIVMLIIGFVGFEPYIRNVSMLITLAGIIWLFFGRRLLMAVAFPLGYLLFMIPLPYIFMKSFAVGLRLFDAKVTHTILSYAGIPIAREGTTLELPNISLVVADFCTGVLSIVAISAIAVLYAYLTQKRMMGRIILVLLAIPIAITGNVFRLITTVVLAYFFGERVLGSAIHQFHGTINFLFTIALLILAGRVLSGIDNKMNKAVS
ncbi:putative Membrane protein [Candidatus Sulfobium mesophilum]|uniref:Putative Membrane protein n=1 Tax=Candidatus Sulfobium mesophilum TaxID=2016548 RepID=A0A2U3QDN4_9BACT|nr:putative Membrane protein [Candidatus Sulfobium mesophilum]